VERIFDGVTMLLFIFIVLPFIPLHPTLRRMLVWASAIFFGALVLFFLVASSPARLGSIYQLAVGVLVPRRLQSKASGILDRFLEGLAVLRSGRQMLLVFGLSLALWLVEVTKYVFVMQSFPFRQPFYVLMLTTAVVNLATAIPSTPGYLGTFEAAGIATLQLFAVEKEIASSFILALHAALYFPITLLGLFFMWRESLSWQELEEMKRGELCASESSAGD